MTTFNEIFQSSFYVLIVLLLSTSAGTSSAQKAQCVMYGQCGEGDYGTLNCQFDGPPKLIDDAESIEILKQICPEYVKDNKALTCCDANQIALLDANFKLPQRLLGRCPACFANFRKNFCKLTCSPMQSDYIRVSKTQKNDEGKDMVNELIYFINENYVNGLFDSCKRVEGIIPGTRVIDLMCGRQGPKCTGPYWLEFMGSTPDNSGFSPVQINYNITTSNQVDVNGITYFPMNGSTVRCSEPVEPNQAACSCSDCSESCGKQETEAPPTTTTVPITTPVSDVNTESGSKIISADDVRQAGDEVKKGQPIKEEPLASAKIEKNSAPRFKLLEQRLFRRILSPLIVIAPAFADN